MISMAWVTISNEDGSKTLVHSDLYDDVRDFLVDNRELLNDHLAHYGLPRRSGRYKWGSGKDPYQSTGGKRSFKKADSAGERYIKSKLGSSKRAHKKSAKARENEENEKAVTKKHKRASSKKSGKQRKENSKIAKRSKLYKDRGALNWHLQQQLQDDLQRIQMQMMRDQMQQQQQQQQNQIIQQQNQMMQDQIWQQQQLINNYNSTPMFL